MPNATRTSTGFASLNDYLNANRSGAEGLAATVADAASTQAQQGQADANGVAQQVYNQAAAGQNVDPTTVDGYGKAQGELSDASQALGKLGDFGSTYTELGGVYGKGNAGYGGDLGSISGNGRLDANLADAAGSQGMFQATQSRFSGLDSYLGNKTDAANKAGVAAYKAPPAPTEPELPAFASPVKQQPQTTATNTSPNFGGSENGASPVPGVAKNRSTMGIDQGPRFGQLDNYLTAAPSLQPSGTASSTTSGKPSALSGASSDFGTFSAGAKNRPSAAFGDFGSNRTGRGSL